MHGKAAATQTAPGVRWHLELDSEAVAFRPAVTADAVYFVYSPHYDPGIEPVSRIQSLDPATGAAKWSVDVAENPAVAPVQAGGLLFLATGIFADDAFAIHAIDTATGETRWRQDQTAFAMNASTAKGMAASGDALYFYRDDSALFALDAASGTQRWVASPAGGFGIGEPVLNGNLIMAVGVSSGIGTVGAVDATTGEERWRTALSGDVRWTPATAGELAFVSTGDGHVVALEVATGAERWNVALGPPAVTRTGSRPAVANGIVYVSVFDLDGALALALDAATGTEVWRSKVGDMSSATPPGIGASGIYVRNGDRQMVSFDAATGAERWRAPLPGEPSSGQSDEDRAPVVDGGSVYDVADAMGLVAIAESP